MRNRAINKPCALVALALLLAADGSLRPPPRDLVTPLLGEVPQAAEVLTFSGAGFAADSELLGQSDITAAPAQSPERALDVRLPGVTSSPFLVGSSGGRSRVPVTLAGARPAPLEIETGRGVYRSVYDGVDAIAVRDPAFFELAFVVREPLRAPELSFQIGAPESGERVSIERASGAAVVRARTGTPLLRVEPPVAFDAAGVRREGRYEWTGTELVIALNVRDLTPPIVVDPRFAIPFWTLLSDARAPGALTYDAASGSREIRLAFDQARGKPVLLRPVRTQQREDSVGSFGKLAFQQLENRTVSPLLRVAPDGSVTAGPAEREDWKRSFYVESETWEWTGSAWDLLPLSGLGGLIDPAVTYDRQRQRLMVTSGAFPDVNCRNEVFISGFSGAIRCSLGQVDSTYELGADGWSERSIAAPPPPRVRAALASFPPHVILFGGRALEPPPGHPAVKPYGRPYPDNVTGGLLNDTWRYDGERWERVPTANPPIARENAALVFDERRRRLVLVGGTEAGFDIWEFDGTDWVERLSAGGADLPVSLRGRKHMLAAWNPARQTTLLFGGVARKLESCTLDDATIAVRRQSAVNLEALNEAGCLGGYVHDSWEWDGRALHQLTQTAYSGTLRGIPVFRQIQAGASWFTSSTPSAPAPDGSGASPLLPWRYDPDPAHFRLRSTLERAHAPRDLPPARSQLPPAAAVPLSAPAGGNPSFASPLFATEAQPDMVIDAARSTALLVSPEDGRVFETDGAVWSERTPATSPFATGMQDFFAASWDSAAQRIVLFDPRSAATWSHSDAGGWSRLTPTTSPPTWAVDPEVRRERDVSSTSATGSDVHRFAEVARRSPQMTYDRARSRSVMFYSGALWEFDGSSWLQYPAPPGWETCESATLLTYDGLRSRVVAVGCKLPGTTMEWDGSAWSGPFPGPYTALVQRQDAHASLSPNVWRGTLQMSWAHPNAIFESPLLGGVATLDATGKLLTWNGATWQDGPALPEGRRCDWTVDLQRDPAMGVPFNSRHHFGGRDFVPLCFFPPGIEDSANNRILVFRDGVRGLRELRLGVPLPAWEPVKLGDLFGDGEGLVTWTRVHPHPFELVSAEHVTLRTLTDPLSIELLEYEKLSNGSTVLHPDDRPLVLPRDSWRVPESLANNLFWPFRLLPDPISKRIRVLTHRGAVWELGAELRTGPGDACTSSADCAEGFCSPEGVCCNSTCASTCYTCNGIHPGRCEPVVAGAPDPLARCGDGECAGVCSDAATSRPHCVFDAARSCGPQSSCNDGAITPAGHCAADAPSCQSSGTTPAPCPGGVACADDTSCKASCTTRSDCISPHAACDTLTGSCEPDAVSVRASARGVQPSDWEPPARRSPAELAQALREQGFQSDDQGRIVLRDFAMAGVTLTFDPELQTPLTGFRNCMDRITACRVQRHTLDECVAAAPRCVSDTPWADDPAGFDCCPIECLSQYFDLREQETPGKAMISLAESMCYPGLLPYLESLR